MFALIIGIVVSFLIYFSVKHAQSIRDLTYKCEELNRQIYKHDKILVDKFYKDHE